MKESERKAISKYLQKFEEIKIRVPKGNRERYKKLAESKGTSLNALIIKLLDKEIKGS